MHILLHPAYFGSIKQFVAIANASEITFEKHDNFQKQTYRNRCYIASPQGALLLNVPIQHSKKGGGVAHQKYKEVKICYESDWHKTHWKSIQIAYRSSPFFEFYEDDLAPIFEKKHTYLFDLNLLTYEVVCDMLGISNRLSFTEKYSKSTDKFEDFRPLIQSKSKTPYSNTPYTQVQEKHHGFLPNLCILDLLFNEGTNSLNYLKNNTL